MTVPEDIHETAYEFSDLFSHWYGCDSSKRQALTNAFCRAIMDEREACAKSVEECTDDDLRHSIADSIRRRGLT